jgi:hypothetical protein
VRAECLASGCLNRSRRRLSSEMLLADDLLEIYAGAVAEQLVARYLLACRDPYQPASP